MQCLNICIISDCLKHDTVTVHAFIFPVLAYLRSKHHTLKNNVYFSDGAASQYKNFKNFTNLCHHRNDHGLEAEWHFFATSHGKSPCDGIGGTVKCLVAWASLQATVVNHSLTARQMFEWASEHISSITFFLVSVDDVTENEAKFELTSRLPSTRGAPDSRVMGLSGIRPVIFLYPAGYRIICFSEDNCQFVLLVPY